MSATSDSGIVSGIVTNRGGRTCHAAIIARELGIPAIVGCGNATRVIPNEEKITLNDLWRYSKICRVDNIIRPYVEALL